MSPFDPTEMMDFMLKNEGFNWIYDDLTRKIVI